MTNTNIFKNHIRRISKYLKLLEAISMSDGVLMDLGFGVVTKNGIKRYLLGDDGIYFGNEDKTLDKIATIKELLNKLDD